MLGGTDEPLNRRLIAIMLGRLKMDVDECIQEYVGMFKTIFKRKTLIPIDRKGNVTARFDSEVLGQCIRSIVERRGLSGTELFNADTERDCRV